LLELFDFARFFRGGVRRSGVLGTGLAGWVEWVDLRTKWAGFWGWETGFRGLGRGRGGCFGAGFFGFAGAEGVDVVLRFGEGVLGSSLDGELGFVSFEVGLDLGGGGHGHGGLGVEGDAGGGEKRPRATPRW